MPDQTPTFNDDSDDDRIHFEDLRLERIPRQLWEQTLAPYQRAQRYWIAQQVSDERLNGEAMALALEMDMAEARRRLDRREARGAMRRTAAPLPVPHADHAANRATVQVNIRLRADDHARLTHAADAAGMRPTTLARALVLNGAAQILRDAAT